jgi:hypothetical protein
MDSTPRTCFVGDTHGVRERTEQVIARAGALGCHTIIQVGDFGIWPEMRHSRPCTDGFEVEVAAMCERSGVDLLVFVDGNHDWHPWLAAQRRKYEVLVKDPSTVPVEETGRVRWVPRGTVLGVAGLRILFCGGAPSFDPELRVPGLSWWPEEEITTADVARSCASGAAAGGIDVLVTHDVSELVEVPGISDDWDPGIESRHKIERIRSAVRPAWAFSGHYHKRVSTTVDDAGSSTRWELLGCDGNPVEDQMVVVDVATLAGTQSISQVA